MAQQVTTHPYIGRVLVVADGEKWSMGVCYDIDYLTREAKMFERVFFDGIFMDTRSFSPLRPELSGVTLVVPLEDVILVSAWRITDELG